MEKEIKGYEIVENKGRGASGSVYVVIHPNTGAYLAMKEFEDVEDGEREAAILLGLNLPGIPACHDCFEEDGKYYLVMDYLEGENLRKYRENHEDDKETILMQLAELISKLHSLPIPLIHGDLKPENIIITKEARVYLLDFGSAFFENRRPKVFMGTKGYAAPELKEGRCGTESDVYSFGKLMLYLLTGRDPLFFGEKVQEAVLLRMGMKKAHAKIAIRCLQTEPKERFHAMKETVSALKKRRRPEINLSGFAIKAGGFFAFLGLWLYGIAHYAKGRYLILAGCILLIGEMWITGNAKRVSEGEYTEEYRLFLSEEKSQ
jgi:serine/threonine-protein kinase